MNFFSSSSSSSNSSSSNSEGGGGSVGAGHSREELCEVVDGWGVRQVSQEQFNASAERAKAMANVPDVQRLELYGLFKQANVGDVDTKRPWGFDMVNAAKWDAWKKYEGMDREYAMLCYVYYVDFVLTDAGKNNSYLGTSVSILVPPAQEDWEESEEIFSLVNDNDLSAVQAYLKKYPLSANIRSSSNNLTPLHYASDRGFVKIIEALLPYVADINAQDEDGNTPVMTAAISSYKEAVSLLIDNNADISIKNTDGENCISSSMIDKDIQEYIKNYKKK
jgi:diazepam-binding inhibitor (GABA receptor modulating acyl-CoA-binding protein)